MAGSFAVASCRERDLDQLPSSAEKASEPEVRQNRGIASARARTAALAPGLTTRRSAASIDAGVALTMLGSSPNIRDLAEHVDPIVQRFVAKAASGCNARSSPASSGGGKVGWRLTRSRRRTLTPSAATASIVWPPSRRAPGGLGQVATPF